MNREATYASAMKEMEAMEIVCRQGGITTCQARECSYNQDEVCHAPRITVGGSHAACDTYTTAGAIDKSTDAGAVGMCDVRQCVFNDDQRCAATGITLAYHDQHPDCITYRT